MKSPGRVGHANVWDNPDGRTGYAGDGQGSVAAQGSGCDLPVFPAVFRLAFASLAASFPDVPFSSKGNMAFSNTVSRGNSVGAFAG